VAFSSTLEDSFVVVAVGLIGDVSLFKKVIEHCRCFAALEPRRNDGEEPTYFRRFENKQTFSFYFETFFGNLLKKMN